MTVPFTCPFNPIPWAMHALAPNSKAVTVELHPIGSEWYARLMVDYVDEVAAGQAATPAAALEELQNCIRELEHRWR